MATVTERRPVRVGGPFTGVLPLARLAVRRSRWFWLAWILCLWAIVPLTVTQYETLMPDPATAQATVAALEGNVTMRAMLGPPFDLLRPGPFAMWRVGTFVAAMTAIMAALGVIRATRAEEEEGRIELLRAGIVGRHAPLAAGVLVAVAGCIVLGALIAATLAALAPPVTGAVAVGAGIALVGTMFVGIGAVCAQLAGSARGARSLAMYLLAAMYVLRAVADASPDRGDLGWFSPVQWAALVRPYVDERWWVLLLPCAVTVVTVGLAFALEARRDHGAGLWASRPGRAHASAALVGPLGLALRLHRSSIVGWSIGTLLTALAIGSIGAQMDEVISSNPQLGDLMRAMGGDVADAHDAFSVAMLAILATVLALFALQLLGRLHTEELHGRIEPLLATATSRTAVAASHLAPCLVVPTLVLVAAGSVVGAASRGIDGAGELAVAAAVLAPGIWLVVALGAVVLGWVPRLWVAVFLLVGWSVFVVWLGAVLGLPEWVTDLHPWGPLPALPAEELRWTPVLLMSLAALGLLGLGLVGYRRRDIAGK